MVVVFTLLLVAMAASLTSAYTPTLARDMYNMVPMNQVPYTVVQLGNVSQACTNAVSKVTEEAEFLIADAAGKPAAGAFAYNLMWMGHYDECRAIHLKGPNETTDFRYCTIQMQVDGTTIIPGVVLPVSWGVCAPMDCSVADVTNGVDMLTKMAKVDQYFHPNPDKQVLARSVCSEFAQYDAGFISVVTFCSLMLLLMLSSALYQAASKVKCQRLTSPLIRLQSEIVFENSRHGEADDDDVPLIGSDGNLGNETVVKQPNNNFTMHLIQSFSLSTNLSKLLDSNQSDRSISCLNGLRVISMSWVILGHIYAFATMTGGAENIGSFVNYSKRFGIQAIVNATFSVDSFFFLSGLLVSYLTLMRMAKTGGKIPWFWFYFHRFWRLTPVYMFTILFYMYLAPHMGKGPFWFSPEGFGYQCDKYWWTNLLYINNFYPKSMGDMCIGWTWYLANDMQFFIICPIFLIMLFKLPFVGMILLGAAMNASFLSTALIIWYYKLPVLFSLDPTLAAGHPPPMDAGSLMYEKPYCRIAPYLVGIALGYIMYRIGNRKVQLNPIAAFVGWLVAAGIAISVLYGTYPSVHGNYQPVEAAEIIYGTVSRFAWAISLAWIVFACNYGYGGWINSILSWSGWVILSRLTYTAYLVHPIVIFGFYFNFGSPIHFSIYLFSVYFAGCLAISYGLAACFSITIEFPFAGLEKLFMPRDVQSKRKVEAPLATRNENIQ